MKFVLALHPKVLKLWSKAPHLYPKGMYETLKNVPITVILGAKVFYERLCWKGLRFLCYAPNHLKNLSESLLSKAHYSEGEVI